MNRARGARARLRTKLSSSASDSNAVSREAGAVSPTGRAGPVPAGGLALQPAAATHAAASSTRTRRPPRQRMLMG